MLQPEMKGHGQDFGHEFVSESVSESAGQDFLGLRIQTRTRIEYKEFFSVFMKTFLCDSYWFCEQL